MSDRLPSLEALRVFEACARHLNFTGAARELGVTPAAVSLRIRDLENALACPLFTRKGPRVALTSAGERLSQGMTRIMAMITAEIDVCRAAVEPLRISCAPTFAARWLAPRIAKWNGRAGDVPVRLDVSDRLDANDRFDIAIRSGGGPWPGLVSVAGLPVDRSPMASPRVPGYSEIRAPEELLAFPLLPDDHWPRWFEEAGIDGTGARFEPVAYPTQELAAMAAVHGAGVALLSPTLFRSLLDEGQLVAPLSVVLSGPDAYQVLKHADHGHPAVQRFCDWLVSELSLTFDQRETGLVQGKKSPTRAPG